MKLKQYEREEMNFLFLLFFIGSFQLANALCDNSYSNKKKKQVKNKVEKVRTQRSLLEKMHEEDNFPIQVLQNSEITTISPEENRTTTINSVNPRNSSSNFTGDMAEDPEVLRMTAEDLKIKEEWGGNCTVKHWDKCKCVRTWFGYYEDETDLVNKEKHYEIDCFVEPVICMKNGWTVSRCHLLCMGECNKGLQTKYDKYVSHEGECKAHAHG